MSVLRLKWSQKLITDKDIQIPKIMSKRPQKPLEAKTTAVNKEKECFLKPITCEAKDFVSSHLK